LSIKKLLFATNNMNVNSESVFTTANIS
jgi:hypothetical protein